MDKKVLLLVVAGLLVVVLLVVYGWDYLFRQRPPSAEELANLALTASSPDEQDAAAATLVQLGVPAKAQMRRVLAESTSPAVRAAVIVGLSSIWDYGSMSVFLDALDDGALVVRSRAKGAVGRLLMGEFPYEPGAPPEERQAWVKAYRDEWEKFRVTPGYKKSLVKLKNKGFDPE
jgi:hypothetical protein